MVDSNVDYFVDRNDVSWVKLRVKCPQAKSFNKGTCSDQYYEWNWEKCGHKNYIIDKGECDCRHQCVKNCFIGTVGFKCNDSTHKNGYTSYAATDFMTQLSVIMDGVNVASIGQKERLNFMGRLMQACLMRAAEFS